MREEGRSMAAKLARSLSAAGVIDPGSEEKAERVLTAYRWGAKRQKENREYWERKARRAAAGLCVHCGRRERGDGYKRCIVCRGQIAKRQREKYQREKKEAKKASVDRMMYLAELLAGKGKSKYAG